MNERNENCQRCGRGPDPDLRTLWMACFYEMDELGLPFEKRTLLEADAAQLTLAKEPAGVTLSDGRKLNLTSGRVTVSGDAGVKQLYTLRVCKACRSTWMGAIKQWFNNVEAKESCGSGIFVRRNGTNVEVTEEEWAQMHPEREPVRARCSSCHGTKKILEDHDGRAGYRHCKECE